MPAVKKHAANPVLWANRENSWEAEAAFNGCPVQEGGRVHLLYRAESLPQQVGNATLRISSIGHAVAKDGAHFSQRSQFLKPQEPWDRFGCEDPRVTRFEGTYVVCYTALSTYPFSADGIKIGVALTNDFKTVTERHLVTPFNAKAMALFPERVGGKIAAILTAHTDRPPAKIALAFFDTLEELWSAQFWETWHAKLDAHALALERSPNDHVEVGAPPIRTKEGWLLVYSYIRNYFSGQKLFGIEAVLLDLINPRKIIARTDKPLIIPEEDYELYGRVPQIVFPSGAFVKGDTLFIYYGAADTTCCLAMCSISLLLDEMRLAAKLERFSQNPIITPRSDHNWEARATLNPGAVYAGGRVHLLYRALSPDGTSSLGYAASKNGFSITERLSEPVYVPREDFEKKLFAGGNSGCEDPRLTLMGQKVYMCYTAFDGRNVPRVALTSIALEDFLARRWNWKRPMLISPPGLDDKDAAIFPAKINGKFAVLHRLGVSVWIDFVDDLEALGEKKWLGGGGFL